MLKEQLLLELSGDVSDVTQADLYTTIGCDVPCVLGLYKS